MLLPETFLSGLGMPLGQYTSPPRLGRWRIDCMYCWLQIRHCLSILPGGVGSSSKHSRLELLIPPPPPPPLLLQVLHGGQALEGIRNAPIYLQPRSAETSLFLSDRVALRRAKDRRSCPRMLLRTLHRLPCPPLPRPPSRHHRVIGSPLIATEYAQPPPPLRFSRLLFVQQA
ncbi:hypothetical protein LZ32DRAFT_605176 [Colletotrichum eremochloae]|nr:hypothetical protein LZ32DRAFT_605176 [Colletotrichum eremochloae]